jgi:hypothetical protein
MITEVHVQKSLLEHEIHSIADGSVSPTSAFVPVLSRSCCVKLISQFPESHRHFSKFLLIFVLQNELEVSEEQKEKVRGGR